MANPKVKPSFLFFCAPLLQYLSGGDSLHPKLLVATRHVTRSTPLRPLALVPCYSVPFKYGHSRLYTPEAGFGKMLSQFSKLLARTNFQKPW